MSTILVSIYTNASVELCEGAALEVILVAQRHPFLSVPKTKLSCAEAVP